jgi:hypothetical protein
MSTYKFLFFFFFIGVPTLSFSLLMIIELSRSAYEKV